MLIAFGSAEASGRAACRAEFGLAPRIACYAEQIVWSSGPLELAAGVDLRWPGGVTPYTALGLYLRDWWAVLELGASVPDAKFRVAISAGVRW